MLLEKINPAQAIPMVKEYLSHLQTQICEMLETEEGEKKFIEDPWEYREGGGGISRVLTDGKVIEKGGVNFSHVFGESLPSSATVKRPELANIGFEALGISVVIHPLNPYAPTTHANLRFFISKTGHWWFGGGFDLTPYYGFVEDCKKWHGEAKQACDPFGLDIYSRYKQWCDEYFYLKHRNEPRGIGGLFFDDLNEWGFDQCFAFIKRVGEHFIKAYQSILTVRKHFPFSEQERLFQLYRRGRYVEFNLLYDRGTLFGLQSGGRTESILISLPPLVSWQYNWQPKPGSREEELYKEFLVVKEWI